MEEEKVIHSLSHTKDNKFFIEATIFFFIVSLVSFIVLVMVTLDINTLSGYIVGGIAWFGIYLMMLKVFLGVSTSAIVEESGITINYYNFKIWTEVYSWEEYEEIKIESTQFGGWVMDLSKEELVMTFCKKKRSLKDFIFSGNVSAICTEENYALVKSWIPESVRIPKVEF